METYNLKNDIKVFGEQVKTFPNGVGDAFEHLIKMFPVHDKRNYYGIATTDKDGHMAYYAAAEETYKGEAEKYKCRRYTIEKGEYLAETLEGWQDKIHCIKDVFAKLIQDKHADKMKPGIEWYKNDKEMMCMVRTMQSNK